MQNFKPLPTKNSEWGLWGTSQHNEYDTEMVWNAVSQILSSEFELTPEQTRDLLDTRFGRHLADDLSFIKGGPTTPGLIYEHIRERLQDEHWRDEYEEAVQGVKPQQKRSRAQRLILQRNLELQHIAVKHFKIEPESYNTRYPDDVEFFFTKDNPLTLGIVQDALLDAYAAGFNAAKKQR